MGVRTSEVGYTSAMPRREDHEVHKRTCGGTGRGKLVSVMRKDVPLNWTELAYNMQFDGIVRKQSKNFELRSFRYFEIS